METDESDGNEGAVEKSPVQGKDPLHGVTLEMMVQMLEEKLGWGEMGARVRVRCFNENPSVSSSLKFLRKTPWARAKVEALYLRTVAGG